VVCPKEVTSDSEVEGGAQDAFLQNLVKKKERKKERNEPKRSILKWQDKFLILWG